MTDVRNRAEVDASDALVCPLPQRRVKVGVVGYGYWGPKLLRNFRELPAAEVVMLADLDEKRLAQACQAHPGLIVTRSFAELLDSDAEAVVVATPVSTHFALAMECLRHGKHVLVEKPLARSHEEGELLVRAAAEFGRTLMVGHTFAYNPAVEMLRQMVLFGEIGRVYYVTCVRTNLGIFQKDVNVLWDLAPHDISILLYVLGVNPLSVSACGQSYVQPGIHDVSRMTINFPNQIQAHVHVSWLDPCKVRRITVVGDKRMVIYDDVEPLEKLKVYDVGVDVPERTDSYGEFQLSYRYGDIFVPRVPPQEPLKLECAHFLDCVLSGRQPRSDGVEGLKVVKILESANRSLLHGGLNVPVEW